MKVVRPSLMLVGGFLGAGKTTAIRALGKLLSRQGKTVSAITNDQAAGLVDTAFLKGSGLAASEVAGSCFCCNFDGLLEAITKNIEEGQPDIILAEPVGSCTDLVATVIRPMRFLEANRLEMLAYSVLMEPLRWKELMEKEDDGISSMKFLFNKQLEEADFILITKSDTLKRDELEELSDEVARRYPNARVLAMSAFDETGLEKWLDMVTVTRPGERYLKEIDYDQYARAEADLGWLNAKVSVQFRNPTDGNAFSVWMADELRKGLAERRGYIGNLKILAADRGNCVKCGMSLVEGTAILDNKFQGPLARLDITVNVRATVSPKELITIMQGMITRIKAKEGARAEVCFLNTFRPSPPNPTYRYNME